MFDKFQDFSSLSVDDIAKQMNQPSVPQTTDILTQPSQASQPNELLFPKPKPEPKIEDFYPEAKVYVGLLDNGLKWGLPVIIKKVYNVPTEEECDYQFELHKTNYANFLKDYESFGKLAETEKDELQIEIYQETKAAYEKADKVWEMYPLIKKAVEQRGLDEGETKLLEKALATWLYQNRDKVQNPMITIAVVLASSVGSRFAELELTGAKSFKPAIVDESRIKQVVKNNHEQQNTKEQSVEIIPATDGGGLSDEGVAEEQ